MKEYFWPLLAGLVLASIALSGGAKNYQNNSQNNSQNGSQNNTNGQPTISTDTSGGLYNTGSSGSISVAGNRIQMSWSYYGTAADQEYIQLDADPQNSAPINITGYSLVSTSTNNRITIPQSVQLYFTKAQNAAEDVWLFPGERAYIITGRSPLANGFRVNKCSNYLTQDNAFTPPLYASCTPPRDEDISSIPRTNNNNNCFDLINTLSTCQRYTGSLGNNYSYECQQFVSKINYDTCLDKHKNDSDFWAAKTWYVYLRRDNRLWQDRHENVLLQDRDGKTIARISKQ